MFALLAALLALSGCRGFNPVPAWNRSGEYYSLTCGYTKWRDENGRDFCGLGKALVQGGWTGGQSAMIALPLPTLFLGIPIAYAEKFTICPVIDTLMLPRDLYIRKSLRDEAKTGVLLELVVYWAGRPRTFPSDYAPCRTSTCTQGFSTTASGKARSYSRGGPTPKADCGVRSPRRRATGSTSAPPPGRMKVASSAGRSKTEALLTTMSCASSQNTASIQGNPTHRSCSCRPMS